MKDDIIKEEDDILYTESVPISIFVTIVITLLILLSIITAIVTLLKTSDNKIVTISISVTASVFFSFIWLNFRVLKIRVTNSVVEVKYGIFNKKDIQLKNLVKIEVARSEFKNYWGFGVRIGFDGSLAFTTDFKDAIRLLYSNNKIFLFSTRKPQKLAELLNELMKK